MKSVSSKVFNDPVHGHIELPYLIVQIIDTPQFQRLRNIRQLGTTNFVYHAASHSRFEHSLGVCYLAGELINLLMLKQPELGITEADSLCVQIAGLCHDLGHGPFSHSFESFMNRIDPNVHWSHENASVKMFRHIIAKNKLTNKFNQFQLDQDDLEFIEYLIDPLCSEHNPFVKRPNKHFLSEIVCNKYSGMDVDKWDYFARDCYYLNLGTLFDYHRFIKYARVIDVDGELHISTREKEMNAVNDLYITRTMLHRRAYQHPVAKAVEIMIVDVLLKANDAITLQASGKQFRISECVNDMNAFELLDDRILYLIQTSTDPSLEQSRQLLRRIDQRDFYKFIGVAVAKDQKYWKACESGWADNNSIIANEICQTNNSEIETKVEPDHLFIGIYMIKCNINGDDPCKFMFFYNKRQINKNVPINFDKNYYIYPSVRSEQHIIVFCKCDEYILPACVLFKLWCTTNGFALLKLNSRSIYER
ncbi:hypothetical protein GJ496_006987 [Pomphorhynchus laevis]|nr:hypothetical protein GJ496_006987 [Pomphorhynchus laevis]